MLPPVPAPPLVHPIGSVVEAHNSSDGAGSWALATVVDVDPATGRYVLNFYDWGGTYRQKKCDCWRRPSRRAAPTQCRFLMRSRCAWAICLTSQ